MTVQSKEQLRKNITRWIRELKKKLAKATATGGGSQKPLNEAEQILFETTRKNKKTLDQNLRVIKNPYLTLMMKTVNTLFFSPIS